MELQGAAFSSMHVLAESSEKLRNDGIAARPCLPALPAHGPWRPGRGPRPGAGPPLPRALLPGSIPGSIPASIPDSIPGSIPASVPAFQAALHPGWQPAIQHRSQPSSIAASPACQPCLPMAHGGQAAPPSSTSSLPPAPRPILGAHGSQVSSAAKISFPRDIPPRTCGDNLGGSAKLRGLLLPGVRQPGKHYHSRFCEAL